MIVNFTPTGIIPGKADHPGVPLAPEEIADEVLAAREIGISMVHLHARGPGGEPSHSAEVYGRIIELIRREDRELVICVSLSGRFTPDVEARAEALGLDGDLKPDMGSLTLSSLNFSRQASVNEPATIQSLARMMRDRGIVPELEIFDLGMANYVRYLIDRGLVEPPCYANLILGGVATAQADLAHAGLLLRELPPGCLWAMGGIGAAQLTANTLAIASGGGVRVGLEDNLYWDASQRRLATNRELLRRVADLAAMFDRRTTTPAELRKALHLAPGDGQYGRLPSPVNP